MVDPVARGTSHAIPPSMVDFARPPALPQAAVVVTPPEQVPNSGTATTGSNAVSTDAVNDTMNPLEKALEMVNNNMKAWSTGMRFEVDPEAQRVVISIVDTATGDVLRTVPSDAVIRMAKMIVQLQGASIDTKV